MFNVPNPSDASQDADHTILIPRPGGKERQPVALDPVAPALPSSTAPLELYGVGLNPLVRAANPLLNLVESLRSMTTHANVDALRLQLVHTVKKFEADAKAARIASDAIAVARYALCTFLDETIAGTPWGANGLWASKSLLIAFHNEAFGGEKFFLILQRLAQDAPANLDVLELMYLCLALGLEGRYRLMENGRQQLDALRERLLQLIQKERGVFERDLSVRWKGATDLRHALIRIVPLWVMAAIVGVVLLILHLSFSFSLHRASDPVFAQLQRLQLFTSDLTASQPAVAPSAEPVMRVAGFLASEIQQGLVSVTESADRSTIILRGDGLFASGSAEVAPAFESLLARIGDALQSVPGKVMVIGHTDDLPGRMSARFPSNWALSKARAGAVAQLLASRAGPAERYTIHGRGDTEPVAPNDSAANRARNRRVVMVVFTPAVAP